LPISPRPGGQAGSAHCETDYGSGGKGCALPPEKVWRFLETTRPPELQNRENMGYHGFLWSVNGINWNNPVFTGNFAADSRTGGAARHRPPLFANDRRAVFALP
jgi:hypothetical protein